MRDDKIEFIDPATGESHFVAPRRETIELAERLGYIPASAEDDDAVDDVMLS